MESLLGRLPRGHSLCLLPVTRVHLEAPLELTPAISVYPARHLAPEPLRVVGWPLRDFEELKRRHGFDLGGGMEGLSVEGPDLPWLKSASTLIDLPDFFGNALVALPVSIDQDTFLDPPSHETHLEMLGAVMSQAESVFDLIRFERCNLWTPQTLPGRVGLLADTSFCAGLFYFPNNHESYVIAGEILSHRILSGIGLDLTDFGHVPAIGSGEVGAITRHGLRLFSEAMEAATATSKFVQMMSLLEFLAAPDDYVSMEKVKRAIGRHVARNKAEYEEIIEDFFYLTSKKGHAGEPNQGLRHNIVHCGKRLEELTTPAERVAVFRRLWRYAGCVLGDLINHSDGEWSRILDLRKQAVVKLGLVAATD